MRRFDEQEQQIIRTLIRNPRCSDNRISTLTGVPVRTVSRKRARLEQEDILFYYAAVDMQAQGTGRFSTQHMLTIKFKLASPAARSCRKSAPNLMSPTSSAS
jgi:DNA-binding Lrp family transcriptional regulator